MNIGTRSDKGAVLRSIIKEKGMALLPGATSAFGAKLIEAAGFDGVYVTSYGLHADMLAANDIDLLTLTEMVDQARYISQAVDIPVVVDGESGGGNIESTIREIRLYEEAGVSAIQIDDERKPCKCPYDNVDHRQELVSIDEMCRKIEAAVKTRKSDDTLIIARSDTLGSVYDPDGGNAHLEEQVKRLNAYANAGADVIFPVATVWKDYLRVASEVKAPYKLCCLGDLKLHRPEYDVCDHSVEEFKDAGFNIYILPLITLQLSGKVIQDGLARFKESGIMPLDMYMRQKDIDSFLRMSL